MIAVSTEHGLTWMESKKNVCADVPLRIYPLTRLRCLNIRRDIYGDEAERQLPGQREREASITFTH